MPSMAAKVKMRSVEGMWWEVSCTILLRRPGGNRGTSEGLSWGSGARGPSWELLETGVGRGQTHRQPWLGSAPRRHSQGSRTSPEGVLP